jgi:L-amino acid N-acyltransferase YncA
VSTAKKLKDGSEVVIRPAGVGDLERAMAFFSGLPAEDRAYLKIDVCNRDVVRERLLAAERGQLQRLVAVVDDRIVANGVLESEGPGWKGHLVEMRLIVARSHRRKGLGMIMARELYLLANREHVREITAKLMRPQTAARTMLKKFGFREDTMIPDYVQDQSGKAQDLLVMRCDMDTLWKGFEDYLEATDWRRAR